MNKKILFYILVVLVLRKKSVYEKNNLFAIWRSYYFLCGVMRGSQLQTPHVGNLLRTTFRRVEVSVFLQRTPLELVLRHGDVEP